MENIMATNNQLFDSLVNILSHSMQSVDDIGAERREELKAHCIELIQDDRRLNHE